MLEVRARARARRVVRCILAWLGCLDCGTGVFALVHSFQVSGRRLEALRYMLVFSSVKWKRVDIYLDVVERRDIYVRRTSAKPSLSSWTLYSAMLHDNEMVRYDACRLLVRKLGYEESARSLLAGLVRDKLQIII